jgi:uncharacterized protein
MTTLDGYQMYGFFHAGSLRVSAARKYLDRINVFPVPDGDTGTNLSFTLSGALAATVPAASAAVTLGNLADAAILAARGNSGVIFAQFVTGLSEAVESTEIKVHEFIAGVRRACLRAKAAVTNPRDGTMLSVIEDWAAALSRRGAGATSIVELIGATRDDLRRSLSETTGRLPELKAADVVDAGAAGFVEFVEGGHEFLAGGMKAAPGPAEEAVPVFEETAEAAPSSPPAYRYCTEALVSGGRIDAEAVRTALADCGDCLIVAGSRKRVKIHVHTDDPSLVMARLSRFGTVGGQKADDMLLQYRDAHDRAAKVAIVTDSSCDLSAELMEKHRIHAVPLMILADENEYLDKLTLDASRLRALCEGGGTFPRTSQPPAQYFSRLYANLASHYEGVLAIHLSAAMSGTFTASRKEAEKWNGKIAAFDSRHLSGSLGLLVLRAAEAVEAGASQEEVLARLDGWSAKARILVSVPSLRYMVKGGRVSPLKGWIANALNLKPVVSVDAAGQSVLYGQAFSQRTNLRKIVRMVAEEHRKAPLRYWAVGHAGALESAVRAAAELEKVIGFPPLYLAEISSVVALNAGPGAVSVVTMRE